MATTTAPPPTPNIWPLFDLFLDVPHPAASPSCPPPFSIAAPSSKSGGHTCTGTGGHAAPATLAEELAQNMAQIARFAFPEFDDQQQPPPPPSTNHHHPSTTNTNTTAPPVLNKWDRYALKSGGNTSFSYFGFSLQLTSGLRVYGHVRRYLPPHGRAPTRYDVGRRGERALVLLTRATGADLLYAALLKSIEAISSQQAALARDLHPHAEPQKWFLHQLYYHQQHLARIYAAKPLEERGKPLMAALEGLELGSPQQQAHLKLYKDVDCSRFILPTCLLYPRMTSTGPSAGSATDPNAAQASSILPLLRCVGVAHALRLLSALLSERRVLMVSTSPTRLAACGHAALSMLAQGLLIWQHLYIPVLPPHLWPYLAAPYPYLIGILTPTLPRLDRTDGLGEVLIIHLDANQLETRGIAPAAVNQRLPDLFDAADTANGPNSSGAATGGGASPTDLLAQDLMELLKTDKKILYGESTLANVGETAARAGRAVKSAFLNLRDRGRQYLQQRAGSSMVGDPANDVVTEEDRTGPSDASLKSVDADYIFAEGCHNEVCEEEVRVAFTAFFLCMFGNMRWYLTTPGSSGQVPQLDRQRFLQSKRGMGEGEGTPIWPLLQNFCQTQMLEEFVKARVEEIRTRQPVTPDAPLFAQCANYHRQNNIDFSLLNVCRIARQVAQSNPSRVTGMLQTNARRNAMALTSNKAYEGDYSKAVADLVEQCRESSSVLYDVMSVIWVRLRDCKGMQWKHGYQALHILRNLLYHGPLAAVAEATDGLEKIRVMKYYENARGQSVQQVRSMAQSVYTLLVDRAKLFQIRRVYADLRLHWQNPRLKPTLIRAGDLRLLGNFRGNHAAMHPMARGTIAKMPPAPSAIPSAAVSQYVAPSRPIAALPSDDVDLLFGAPDQPPASNAPALNNDLVDLFGGAAISGSNDDDNDDLVAAPPPRSFDPVATQAPVATPRQVPPQAYTQNYPAPHQPTQGGPQVQYPSNPFAAATVPSAQYQANTLANPMASAQVPLPHQPSQVQPSSQIRPGAAYPSPTAQVAAPAAYFQGHNPPHTVPPQGYGQPVPPSSYAGVAPSPGAPFYPPQAQGPPPPQQQQQQPSNYPPPNQPYAGHYPPQAQAQPNPFATITGSQYQPQQPQPPAQQPKPWSQFDPLA